MDIKEKIDYSKVDKKNLEIFFGINKAKLLIKLSNLELKIYNDSVNKIHYYHKDNIPYIEYHVKNNEIYVDETIKSEDIISVVEIILDLKNIKFNNSYLNKNRFNIIEFLTRYDTLEKCCNQLNIDIPIFNNINNNLLLINQYHLTLMIINQTLNEGWTPDWSDSSQYKYYPWFNMNNSSSGVGFSFRGYGDRHSYSPVASCLCFKSKELCEYAGNRFLNYYKQYFLLNSK